MLISITFFAALVLTLVGILFTVLAGRRADRPAHVKWALSTVSLLVLTIVLALVLGRYRDFPEEQMGIHKIFARTGGLMVLPVAFTGLMLWRRPGWRTAHKVCVYLFILVAVIAAGTGVWVFSLSTPKA